MKKIIAIALSLIMLVSLAACGGKDGGETTTAPAGATAESGSASGSGSYDVEESFGANEQFHKDTNPVVTMTMEDGSQVLIELFPEQAPNTVNNFISLVSKGFYDGLTFHRIIAGFMIQGGDPDGTGFGGVDYSIKGEFAQNGFDNPVKHERGTLSMARSPKPDSAGSQFFICHAAPSHLDGQYAAFGQVIKGLDVVDKIASVKTDANDKPLEPVVIKTMTVDLMGQTYAEPETIPG